MAKAKPEPKTPANKAKSAPKSKAKSKPTRRNIGKATNKNDSPKATTKISIQIPKQTHSQVTDRAQADAPDSDEEFKRDMLTPTAPSSAPNSKVKKNTSTRKKPAKSLLSNVPRAETPEKKKAAQAETHEPDYDQKMTNLAEKLALTQQQNADLQGRLKHADSVMASYTALEQEASLAKAQVETLGKVKRAAENKEKEKAREVEGLKVMCAAMTEEEKSLRSQLVAKDESLEKLKEQAMGATTEKLLLRVRLAAWGKWWDESMDLSRRDDRMDMTL